MADYSTVFGSLDNFRKGGVDIIDDDPKNYAFSNVFEVAARSRPYERVAVGKNFEYVIEAVRAEGASPWYGAAHDEFALCMDGEITIEFVKLKSPPSEDKEGAVLVKGEPEGPKVGTVKLKRGHQALLPGGCAYRFNAAKTGVIMQQTILGELSVEKWREICLH